MATTEGEVVIMIIEPKANNKIFYVQGEIYIYWAEWIYRLKCKYFGHEEIEWHCMNCHICIEHEKETCEY
jgi:hypothetical protein